MKASFIILISIFFSINGFGQTAAELKKEIIEHKFTTVSYKKIPLNIIDSLGCNSYDMIGTKASQTGCTSGRRLVIFWVVTDNNGIWIMHNIAHGGTARWDNYYVISNIQFWDVPLTNWNLMDFESFKTAFIEYYKQPTDSLKRQ